MLAITFGKQATFHCLVLAEHQKCVPSPLMVEHWHILTQNVEQSQGMEQWRTDRSPLLHRNGKGRAFMAGRPF